MSEAVERAIESPTEPSGHSLHELSHESTVLLVCLRHLGCTFCRETRADLGAVRGRLAAFRRGHGVGRLQDDGFRMPGAFVLENGRVVAAFRHRHAGERPEYCDLAGASPATLDECGAGLVGTGAEVA